MLTMCIPRRHTVAHTGRHFCSQAYHSQYFYHSRVRRANMFGRVCLCVSVMLESLHLNSDLTVLGEP